MLSKKMAFSLMRLIMILALAFAVPSAMAGDFEIKIEGRTAITYAEDALTAALPAVMLKVTSPHPIPDLATGQPINTPTDPLSWAAFDKDGFHITNPGITVVDDRGYAMRTAKVRRLSVVITPGEAPNTIARVIITLKSVESTDPTVADADDMSKAVHHTITVSEVPAFTADLPKVVSIQRLRPSSQAVVSAFEEAEITGAFDVRIVLTEKPYNFKLGTINVEGGTASNLVVGVPFSMLRTTANDVATTYRPHPSEGMYEHNLPNVVPGVVGSGNVPEPTGRDNMYHQYRVTVTPHRGVNAVKISIKEFHDSGLPITNVYVPTHLAYKPNGREQLRLLVAATTTAPGTGVMASLPQSEGGAQTEVAETGAEAKATANVAVTTDVDVSATEAVKVEAPDTSVMIPMEGQIYISEVMFAGGGILPQWIEISNGSRTEEVNLSGWTLTVENATADADVSVGAKAVFTIPEGTRIDASGQHDTPSTVLVVTEQGRNNLSGAMAAGQMVNLWIDQQTELIRLDIFNRRYSLLSDMAFKITLAPPVTVTEQTAARAAATDVVGNLGTDGTAMWALPMDEGDARSSILRRHVSAEPKDGEMMDAWVLASDTSFSQSMHLSAHSYYGLPIDIGTPGFRAGGALPVELSHFRPARNKETGAVVITWSTQSELNNAGFFIKRSQQRDGEFTVINAAMIPGAGTTSEKQSYTYEDTTAQPNVVYYYQIEDVTFDGQRRTLARGIRLRGYVGAAGKATRMWGELKATQ